MAQPKNRVNNTTIPFLSIVQDLELEQSIPVQLKKFLGTYIIDSPQRREDPVPRVMDMVYVQNMRGESIQPTLAQKAKKLIKQGKARRIFYTPYTIQLQQPSGHTTTKNTLNLYFKKEVVYCCVVDQHKNELFSCKIYLDEKESRKKQLIKPMFMIDRYENVTEKTTPADLLILQARTYVGNYLRIWEVVINRIKFFIPFDEICINTAHFSNQLPTELKFNSDSIDLWWYHYREKVRLRYSEFRCNECKSKGPLYYSFLLNGKKDLSFHFLPLQLCERCDTESKLGLVNLHKRKIKNVYVLPGQNVNPFPSTLVLFLREKGFVVNTTTSAQIHFNLDKMNLEYSSLNIPLAMNNSDPVKSRLRKTYGCCYKIPTSRGRNPLLRRYVSDKEGKFHSAYVIKQTGTMSYIVRLKDGSTKKIQQYDILLDDGHNVVFFEQRYNNTIQTNQNPNFNFGSYKIDRS